jgi:hypothetical protein
MRLRRGSIRYAEGGWPSRRQGGDRQLDGLVDKLHIRTQARRTALRRMAHFLRLFSLSFLRGAEERRVDFAQRRMK